MFTNNLKLNLYKKHIFSIGKTKNKENELIVALKLSKLMLNEDKT